MKCRKSIFVVVGMLYAVAPLRAQTMQPTPKDVAAGGEYILNDFGDVSTPAAIQATIVKAIAAIKARGGGRLIIPPGIDQSVNIQNSSQTARTPGYVNPPEVTIIDRRGGYDKIVVPSIGKWAPTGLAGTTIRRELNVQGPGVNSWGTSQALSIENRIIHGSSSYLHPTRNAVAKGNDVRIYLYTERGLFVGQYLNYYFGPTYASGSEPITVKSIGWDTEQKQFFITADVTKDHSAAAYLSNKNMVGSLNIDSVSVADNQTAGDFNVIRRQYANGDSFLIGGQYLYQGDVLTQGGDEAGVIFNAEPQSDPNPFYSKVESVDSANDAIVFAPGASYVQKLSSSRPLINMNPKKWITSGTVKIVGQDNWGGFMAQAPDFDRANAIKNGIDLTNFHYTFKLKPGEKTGAVVYGGASPYANLYKEGEIPSIITWDGKPVLRFKYPYQGRAYPSLHMNATNYLGGRIIASADCGWTPDIIGRYFAVDDPGEYLYPGDPTIGGAYFTGNAERITRRWYRITEYWKNADGTHGIRLGRVRMFAAGAGAPNLYNEDNYTWDGHERPLKYVIAPGAMVYDVSHGWKDSIGGDTTPVDPRTMKVVKSSISGTALDFGPGDPIEQAIGPDPAIPRPIRVRMFNQVPNNFFTGAIELGNYGKVQITSALSTFGGGQTLEDIEKRKDRKPSFQYGIDFNAVMGTGILFGADTQDAAIYFQQPFKHAQPIKWNHANGTTGLIVDPLSGDMRIRGSKLDVPNVKGTHGLSGTTVAANNLRGIDVVVPKGAQRFTVRFAQAEPDARYSLNVQPNWATPDAVMNKTSTGFTVLFTLPAPAGATFDWQLIR